MKSFVKPILQKLHDAGLFYNFDEKRPSFQRLLYLGKLEKK